MFGYLVASTGNLTPEELERYRSCYCGLCLSLKARHGQLSRLTLNYDMTFLVLLLGSLYEPVESSGTIFCPAHPKEKRNWFRTDISDYAADMNVALSYLKCVDNWKDDDSIPALAASKFLKKPFDEIKEKYPRQCAAMEQSIFDLSSIEEKGTEDPDAASDTFGHLMGSVFVYKDDRWADTLYRLGHSLGKYIYLLDAVVDLDDDARKNSYNPFRRYYGLNNNKDLFSDILRMVLSDAVIEYEMLPLIQDTAILKNILCTGLWTKFEEKYGPL